MTHTEHLNLIRYGYICRRIHFFDSKITRDNFRRAAGGSERLLKKLQECYLGFVVIRPISKTPFGRTVLKWYPEQMLATPRVTEPSRDYYCHIAGVELKVKGLA